MAVVGGDQGDGEFFAYLHQDFINLLLLFYAVVLKFEEKSPVRKYARILLCRRVSLLDLAVHREVRHLALKASTEGYEPLVIFHEEFLVNAGLVVKTFEIGLREEFAEVMIALYIFNEEHEVVRALASGARRNLFGHLAGRDVDLA